METRLETYMPVYQDGEPDDLIFYWDIYSCPIDVPVLARVGDKGQNAIFLMRHLLTFSQASNVSRRSSWT